MHTVAVLSRAGATVAGLLLAAACTAHHNPAPQQGQHAGPRARSASSPPAKAPTARVGFTIAATGDLLAHEPVVQAAQAAAGGHGYDFRPLLARVRPILSRADLAICHLETPLSPDDRRISYYPDFQAPREIAPAIRWAGFDTCTTASNHTLDDGPAGVAHTLDLLDAAGVRHAGAARNAAEAARPVIYTVRGFRVAHLDYTYGLNGHSVPAGQPWLVPLIDPARILRDAHAARAAGAQFVIVSFHWGQEYSSGVTADQRDVARRLLASPDVDLVLGSHAHVLQAVERIAGKFVVYGMGNFLARHAPCCDSPPTFDGVIVNITVQPRAGRLMVTALTYAPTHVNPDTLVVEPVAQTLRRLGAGAARSALVESWRRTVARMDMLHAAAYGVRPDDPPAGLPTS
ncbi:MAG: CapA family protein [Actinomycetota bacterium]|nr:CapA family protein [Actinomycetota bacterium]